MVSNVKVIVGAECATQHRLVVGDFKVCAHAHPKRRFVPRTKVWKLKDLGNQVEFSNFFDETSKTLDERWKYLKNNLINATKHVCGVSAKHTWKRQTWWWNDKVQQAVSHKRKCFKVWKAGKDRDAYQAAKRASNLAVHSQVMLKRLRSNKSIPNLLRYIEWLRKCGERTRTSLGINR